MCCAMPFYSFNHISQFVLHKLDVKLKDGENISFILSKHTLNLHLNLVGYTYYGSPTKSQSSSSALLQCKAASSYWNDSLKLAAIPGAYENVNWATCQATGLGCNLNVSSPTATLFNPDDICYQGSVPTYVVPVKGVCDVEAAIRYARQFGATLVVKNSGHDLKGRSSGPNSLAIWTTLIRTR